MSALQQHIIAKQTLDIELFGLESEGLALQQALPQLLHERVNLVVEKVLNQYTQMDEYVSIDYLELNLGEIRLEHIEAVLAQQVELCLTRALREKVAHPILNVMRNEANNESVSADVKIQTYAQTVYAAWVYFLHTGRLPWAFKLAENKCLEETLLDIWQTFTSNPYMQAEIKSLLKIESIRQRLIYQFSGEFLQGLLTVLLPSAEVAIVEVSLLLQQLDIAASDKKTFNHYFWQLVIDAAATAEALTTEIILKKIAVLLIASVHTGAVSHDSVNKISLLFKQYGIDLIQSDQLKTNSDAAERTYNDLKSEALPQPLTKKIATSLAKNEAIVTEPIYINFAGLVLLHPFLPQLFKSLAVVVEDELVHQSRAVCLLHYLCTGQTNPAEHELVLAKLLCGLPLDYPVEMIFTPTDDEVEQVASLLTSVLSHWQALKNTSIDGLRGTFLIRGGKLTLKEDGDWQLQVESKGFDILMSSLPWSISMIKLPWMPQMLWVEWAT